MSNYRLGTPTQVDSLEISGATTFASLTVNGTSNFTSHIIVDGYTIDLSDGAEAGQVLKYDGYNFVASNDLSGAGSISIGDAITSSTSKSVLFINSGNLAQDNANFAWDATLHALGIGTIPAGSTGSLQVIAPTSVTAGYFKNTGTSGTTNALTLDTVSSSLGGGGLTLLDAGTVHANFTNWTASPVSGYEAGLNISTELSRPINFRFNATKVATIDSYGFTVISGAVNTPTINNSSDIIIDRANSRKYKIADGIIYGDTDNAYVTVSEASGAQLTYYDSNLSVTVGGGITFTTGGTARARINTTQFGPVSDNGFSLGALTDRWATAFFGQVTLKNDGYATYIEMYDGYADSSSSSDTGRLKYNGQTNHFEISENAGAYYRLNPIAASASDFHLTGTSPTTIVTFTPAAAGNHMVNIYYRVATATTDVTITLTWTDGAGAQTSNIVPITSTAVGSYSVTPTYINNTATAITVSATAGTANNLYVSASIMRA